MPLTIHKDQNREFENKLMHAIFDAFGATKNKTTSYHPQSDGLLKRLNRTITQMLSTLVDEYRDNWDDLLLFVMSAYRTTMHKSTYANM